MQPLQFDLVIVVRMLQLMFGGGARDANAKRCKWSLQ